MKKNYVKTLLLSSSILFISFAISAQNASQKAELKPITTPLKKESPRFTTSTRPINSSKSSSTSKGASKTTGIRGNDVLGEGRYLHFDKKIMSYSVTGEIPEGFPKHVKGQSKEEYIKIMEDWVLANPEKFIEPGDYLDYKEKIKEKTIDGQIPEGFPKYIKGQTREQYIQVMKEWGMNNLDKIKEEYRTPKQ